MKEIKAYKLTNGEILNDKKEAAKRQRAINRACYVSNFNPCSF